MHTAEMINPRKITTNAIKFPCIGRYDANPNGLSKKLEISHTNLEHFCDEVVDGRQTSVAGEASKSRFLDFSYFHFTSKCFVHSCFVSDFRVLFLSL